MVWNKIRRKFSVEQFLFQRFFDIVDITENMAKKLIFRGSNNYKKVAQGVGVMGFTQVFLKSYLTPSKDKIFYENFFLIKPVLFPDYKKTCFFSWFLPARATGLLNQGKALIALVYLRPWYLGFSQITEYIY